MKKLACIRFLACLIAAAVLSVSTFAQTSSSGLPNLPEADALVYLNLRRILSEMLPSILPEKSLADVKAKIDEVKKTTGIDLYGVEHAVIAMRMGKMGPGSTIPDFVLVVHGSFNADALLSLARMGLQGKFQDEKYGSKTVTTVKISDLMKMGDGKNTTPLPIPVSELSMTALDGGTIAVGNLSYVKAAIDASGGQGGIKPELTALAMRQPDALLSIAGLIPPGLLNNLVPKEMKGNEELDKLVSGLDQLYLSLGMSAEQFTLLLMVRTASADQANTLKGLAEMGTHALGSNSKDKTLQEILGNTKITTEGNEVQLRTGIAKDAVAGFVRNMMMPAKKDETAVKAPTKPAASAKTPPQKRATGKRPVKKP